MTIDHHLSDDLLMRYAGAGLSEPWRLAVAAHIGMCSACAARLDALEAVGGAMLDELSVAPIGSDALDICLAAIDGPPEITSVSRPSGLLPGPVQAVVGGDVDDIAWTRVGGGVRQHVIKGVDGMATARLLRIPAGAAVPEHSHNGMELTLVLHGSFSDGDDRFGPGDIQEAYEDVQHTPTAGAEAECVCLVVTDAPLKFRALLPRVVQKFARI